MDKFDYIAPKTLDEALEVLSEKQPDIAVIAGGTDLIPRIRRRDTRPEVVLDLRLLPLKEIRTDGISVQIGACVTHSQVIDSGLLAEQLPALVDACTQMAGPPVRNRGTLGGNLITASPAADSAPPLLVYDAEVVLLSTAGERVVPLHEFFTGPGANAKRQEELMTEIRVPIPNKPTAAAFIKLGKRRAMAISVVSVAARVSLDDGGAVQDARLAFGSVAPTPLRSPEAEGALEGKVLSKEGIAEAALLAREAASPIDDLRASAWYRSKMVGVLTRRALEAVWEELEESK